MEFDPRDMTLQMERLRSKLDAERYERVFGVDPKSFSSYPEGQGPEEDGEHWDTAHDELYPAPVSHGLHPSVDAAGVPLTPPSSPHRCLKRCVSSSWIC